MDKDNFDSIELVSFDLAKKAKFKGYDWGGLKMYFDNNGWEELYKPTRSRLQRWLREKHNIVVWCEYAGNGWNLIIDDDSPKGDLYKEGFDTYEKALDKGLKEAIKLI